MNTTAISIAIGFIVGVLAYFATPQIIHLFKRTFIGEPDWVEFDLTDPDSFEDEDFVVRERYNDSRLD